MSVYPRIGIFIPCYNASSTIQATLTSVQEAIKKTSLEIPVFVYDDCSSDNSVDLAEKAWYLPRKIQVIKNRQNLGERKTTNLAFNDFNGHFDWIFIIHADDIVKEDWLTTSIAFINNSAKDAYLTIWSSYDTLNENTNQLITGINNGNALLEKRSHDTIKNLLTKVYSIWHISGAAINVMLFHQLNGFDDHMAQFGDTDFFVRGLLAGYQDIYIPRALTIYRISEGSVSSVSLRTNRDIKEIFYLIDKFKKTLSKNEASSMYAIIRRLSIRRMVKSIRNREFLSAMSNFKQLCRSFFK